MGFHLLPHWFPYDRRASRLQQVPDDTLSGSSSDVLRQCLYAVKMPVDIVTALQKGWRYSQTVTTVCVYVAESTFVVPLVRVSSPRSSFDASRPSAPAIDTRHHGDQRPGCTELLPMTIALPGAAGVLRPRARSRLHGTFSRRRKCCTFDDDAISASSTRGATSTGSAVDDRVVT